jgi:hypothetical protein
MVSLKKIALFSLIFAVSVSAAFAQDAIKGRLLKATYSGIDTTNLYEPLVTLRQSETLGIKTLALELSGVRIGNNKWYEFYNDGTDPSPVIWKRRMRGVVVKPLNVYITISEGLNNTNNILINYEYKDTKGFGAVSYVIAVEK